MNAATSLTAYKRREKRKRLLRYLTVGFAVCLALLVASLFVARAVTIHQMRVELERLKVEKELAELDQKDLLDLIRRQDDLMLIEYLARTELSMVKKGEKKIQITTTPPGSK